MKKTVVQNCESILASAIAKHGLPVSIGANGWITQTQQFHYDSVPIATGVEGLKGWLYVSNEGDTANYTNTEEVFHIVAAMIDNDIAKQDSTSLSVLNTRVDSGAMDFRTVQINNDESYGKTWEYEIDMEEEKFYEIVSDGDEDVGSEDVQYFLIDNCAEMGGETSYSLENEVAYLEFKDGFKMGFERSTEGNIVVHNYNGEKVTDSTVF